VDGDAWIDRQVLFVSPGFVRVLFDGEGDGLGLIAPRVPFP
jgi:hypothetical protein